MIRWSGMTRRIFIIAGPNGAGKTTTAFSLQPNLLALYEFINADEIARGLAPLHPESMALTASKLMVQRIRDFLIAKKSFAFETTAAGINFIKYLKVAKEEGYEINLMYLWLYSPELAVKRVAHRVAEGGHSVSETVIRRRYEAGLKNLIKHYLPIAHTALILDNSSKEQKVIATKTIGNGLEIEDPKIWEEIVRLAHE
jgi:predicted ABC-type ATPase